MYFLYVSCRDFQSLILSDMLIFPANFSKVFDCCLLVVVSSLLFYLFVCAVAMMISNVLKFIQIWFSLSFSFDSCCSMKHTQLTCTWHPNRKFSAQLISQEFCLLLPFLSPFSPSLQAKLMRSSLLFD